MKGDNRHFSFLGSTSSKFNTDLRKSNRGEQFTRKKSESVNVEGRLGSSFKGRKTYRKDWEFIHLMNGQDKLRPQVLETPYKLQDICPTKKMKSPDDTLRRIQKKVALLQKQLESSGNELGITNSTQKTSRTNLLSLEKNINVDPCWIKEFQTRYDGSWKKWYTQEENLDMFEKEWLTSADIFNRMALIFK